MNKTLSAILKIIIPLGIGVLLIYLAYSKLTEQDIVDIKKSFAEANYLYILLSVIFGIFSHLSRAYRWKYTLEPLGLQPKFANSFFTVMIGYFANLGIPRSGEVLRCGLMAKYENMPFNKLVGTVIAERVADMILLLFFIGMVLILQFDLVVTFLKDQGFLANFSFTKGVMILVIILTVGIAGLLVLKNSKSTFFIKIRGFLGGIFAGIKSILQMKKRWQFIGHTIFIWLMYFLMFYVGFFSLEETKTVPIVGVLTGFVIGGLSIALTNGGIGAYPLGIAAILSLYGVANGTGYAFGWIVWTAQTVMIAVLGAISMLLIPRINKIKTS